MDRKGLISDNPVHVLSIEGHYDLHVQVTYAGLVVSMEHPELSNSAYILFGHWNLLSEARTWHVDIPVDTVEAKTPHSIWLDNVVGSQSSHRNKFDQEVWDKLSEIAIPHEDEPFHGTMSFEVKPESPLYPEAVLEYANGLVQWTDDSILSYYHWAGSEYCRSIWDDLLVKLIKSEQASKMELTAQKETVKAKLKALDAGVDAADIIGRPVPSDDLPF